MNNQILPLCMRQAVKQFGGNIISEPRLINVLKDYHAFTEYSWTENVLNELRLKGILNKFLKSHFWNNKPDTAKIYILAKQKTGYSENQLMYVLKCVEYALGYITDIPEFINQKTAYTISNRKQNSRESTLHNIGTTEIPKFHTIIFIIDLLIATTSLAIGLYALLNLCYEQWVSGIICFIIILFLNMIYVFCIYPIERKYS